MDQTFSIEVNAVNDAPLVENADVVLDEDSSITFDIVATDVDNNISELTLLLPGAMRLDPYSSSERLLLGWWCHPAAYACKPRCGSTRVNT